MDENQRSCTTTPAVSVEDYVRIYREHQPQLVAYARSLTGDGRLAEDLAAEAHFRVWRRISGGDPVGTVPDVPGYLRSTVRNLAHTVRRAASEDPGQRNAYIGLLTGLLSELPRRWTRALWLAEVRELPPDRVGVELGTSANSAAALLHRAREGLRQAFLHAQPGHPADPECARHWDRIPAVARGAATHRRIESVRGHAAWCANCRDRLLALELANRRLPALLGPALLALLAGGATRLLPAGAGRADASGAAGRGRHALRRGAGGGRKAVLAGIAGVAGVAAMGAVALGLTGVGGAGSPSADAAGPAQRGHPSASQPTAAPSARSAPRPTATDLARRPAARSSSVPASGAAVSAAPSPTRTSAPPADAPASASAPTAPAATQSASAAPKSTPSPAPTSSTPTSTPTTSTSTTPQPTPTGSAGCVQLPLLTLCGG